MRGSTMKTYPPIDEESAKDAAAPDESASVAAGVTVRLRATSKLELDPAAAVMALTLQAAAEEAKRKNAVATVTVRPEAGDAIRSGEEAWPAESVVGSEGNDRL
jgi:hypothetical protein